MSKLRKIMDKIDYAIYKNSYFQKLFPKIKE